MSWLSSVCIAFAASAVALVMPANAENAPTRAMSEVQLQERLDQLQKERPDVPGFAIAVIKDGERFTAATGIASPDKTPMTARTPFRLASVTKTFVAASRLRLHEQAMLDIDAPIAELVSAEHLRLLVADDYDIQAITVRHLLMHTSGLNDHFGTQAMREQAFADSQRVWTRTQQLRLMVEETDPVGNPDERFAYSDTGYLLLGEVIEKVTGKPLALAVSELNRFSALGTDGLRWEGETPIPHQPARAHQWLDGIDTFAIDGSIDAFGGGGIIGDVVDTAKYFDALFNSEIFGEAATLNLMMDAPFHPLESPYRLGLFEHKIGGQTVYMHGGFWGIVALHVPELDLTVVGVALDQSGEHEIMNLAFDLILGA